MQNLIKYFTEIYDKYATKKNLKFLVAVFIVLRIIFALITGGEFNSAEDLKIAHNLVDNGQYVLHEHLGPTAIKSPLYPLFLSGILSISGSLGEWAIVIVQHILMGLVPLIMYKTAKLLTDEKRAFFAGLLFLVHFSYFYYPNVIEITNFFVPLLAVFIYQMLKSKESGKYLLLGIISGLLVLLQPTIILVLLLSAIMLFKRMGISKIFKIILIISIMQAPWIYRNYVAFDKFIPTKSPFWMNLYIGILPESQEQGTVKYLDRSVISEIDSLKDKLNDVDMEAYYKKAFMSFWDNRAELFTGKVINHLKYYWYLPPRYIDNFSFPIFIVRVIPNVILLLLMFLGLIRALKENREFAFFVISILFYYTLLFSLTAAVNIRYKLDIEFLQMYLAMYILKPYNSKLTE